MCGVDAGKTASFLRTEAIAWRVNINASIIGQVLPYSTWYRNYNTTAIYQHEWSICTTQAITSIIIEFSTERSNGMTLPIMKILSWQAWAIINALPLRKGISLNATPAHHLIGVKKQARRASTVRLNRCTTLIDQEIIDILSGVAARKRIRLPRYHHHWLVDIISYQQHIVSLWNRCRKHINSISCCTIITYYCQDVHWKGDQIAIGKQPAVVGIDLDQPHCAISGSKRICNRVDCYLYAFLRVYVYKFIDSFP